MYQLKAKLSLPLLSIFATDANLVQDRMLRLAKTLKLYGTIDRSFLTYKIDLSGDKTKLEIFSAYLDQFVN